MNLSRVAILALVGCGTVEPVTPTNHAETTDREAQLRGTWVRRTHVSSPEGGTEHVTTTTITLSPGRWASVSEHVSRKLGNSLPFITEPAVRSELSTVLTPAGLAVVIDQDTYVCAPAMVNVATPRALRVPDGESGTGVWVPPAETSMQVLQCAKPNCDGEGQEWMCNTELARPPGIELGCVSLAGCAYRRMTTTAIVPLMHCPDTYGDC